MRARIVTVLLLTTLVLTACGSDSSPSGSSRAGDTVTLVTHDSFAVSKPVLEAFTKKTGITVKVLKNGDAGAALNQAILTKDNPLGDAFFGVDNTFLSRALKAGIFEKHTAAGLDRIPSALQLDDSHRVTPIDFGDVCINYDKAWFEREQVTVPRDARGPHRTCTQGEARRREPRHFITGARVPAGQRGQVRHRRLGRVLEPVEGQRREGRRRMGAGLRQ